MKETNSKDVCKIKALVNGSKFTCPVDFTLNLIGGKWKIIILWHIMEQTRRFGELKRLMPGITQKMLTQQLRELEADRLINRKVYTQVPPKVEYSMTKHGKDLAPVLNKMCEWGISYLKSSDGKAVLKKNAV